MSCETAYEKPHPEAYRRALGDEVEAVRSAIGTGRDEVRVPQLCFNHGDQENPPNLSQPMPGRCLHVEAKRNPGGDMASNTRIPKAELTGIYGAMVKRMSRKMFGVVPEPVEVAWHNRKVLNFSFSVGRKAQKWDQCDENLKSFAHMAVASLVGCSFCLDLGYFQAHNEGLDLTKAREVPRWRESDVFTPLERLTRSVLRSTRFRAARRSRGNWPSRSGNRPVTASMVWCIPRWVKTRIDTHASKKGDQHGRHRQEDQRGGYEGRQGQGIR